MAGGVLYSLSLFLILTSVSAIKRLKSINDLKQIDFGHSVPKHSLVLLHWFVNTIDMDNNDIMLLTFDPNTDYGSHHYGNYERMLDPLPQGNVRYRYYTLGNLNPGSSMELPSYVRDRIPNLMDNDRNRDRIIFRVREHNTGNAAQHMIDQVYITQHYGTHQHQGTRYDPEHTYRITTNLLRDLREFAVGDDDIGSLEELRERFGSNIDDSQLWALRNKWNELAALGLLLFIVIQERFSLNKSNRNSSRLPSAPRGQYLARQNTQTDFVINIPASTRNDLPQTVRNLIGEGEHQRNQMKLQVMTGNNGNARIHWNRIPVDLLYEGVMVVLFKNDQDEEASKTFKQIDSASGSYDTSVPLNAGLQVRLHKTSRWCCFWTKVGHEIHRGGEFGNPKVQNPVSIRGYDASLELFVKDGKACARLYVKKTFTEWRSAFKKAWVGFYSSAHKATGDYETWQWQWATKFKECTADWFDYVYEYQSSMKIAPGVQARFIIKNYEEIARTAAWN